MQFNVVRFKWAFGNELGQISLSQQVRLNDLHTKYSILIKKKIIIYKYIFNILKKQNWEVALCVWDMGIVVIEYCVSLVIEYVHSDYLI